MGARRHASSLKPLFSYRSWHVQTKSFIFINIVGSENRSFVINNIVGPCFISRFFEPSSSALFSALSLRRTSVNFTVRESAERFGPFESGRSVRPASVGLIGRHRFWSRYRPVDE